MGRGPLGGEPHRAGPVRLRQLLRLGAAFGWDTRDSWRNPRHGWQNEIELWHTGGFLGGDGDWWTVNLDVRRWVPATRRTKLMLSGLLSLQSGTLGEELSGKNQLLGTAEYSLTVIPLRRWDLWKISLRLGAELAVFADAGIAWSESRDLAMRRARGGLGGGLRLLVPGSCWVSPPGSSSANARCPSAFLMPLVFPRLEAASFFSTTIVEERAERRSARPRPTA